MSAAEPWSGGLVELYRERHEPMVRLAYLLTGDRAAAEELVQDAFISVHRSWGRVTQPAAYLRMAVVNACRSWGRRQALERSRLTVPDSSSAASEAGLGADELWDALQRLPERHRAAVVLRFYEDLPDREIAALLGCREATVRTAVFRGLATLRKEVTP